MLTNDDKTINVEEFTRTLFADRILNKDDLEAILPRELGFLPESNSIQYIEILNILLNLRDIIPEIKNTLWYKHEVVEEYDEIDICLDIHFGDPKIKNRVSSITLTECEGVDIIFNYINFTNVSGINTYKRGLADSMLIGVNYGIYETLPDRIKCNIVENVKLRNTEQLTRPAPLKRCIKYANRRIKNGE
jgi:hypothetical protein